jgi:hypothetical protein
MGWKVPNQKAWLTRHHVERGPEPERRSWQGTPMDTLDDDRTARFSDEDFAMLESLTPETATDTRQPLVDCWFAQLACDGWVAGETDHLLFREREQLVRFIQWLSIEIGQIRIRDGDGPRLRDPNAGWNSALGPTTWSFPEDPDQWAWYLGRDWATLVGGDTRAFGTVSLGRYNVRGFIDWIRESATAVNLDPDPDDYEVD